MVEDKEIRLSQYTDDTIIYLSATKKNLINCISILTSFEKISGLKINIEKSNVIRLDNFHKTISDGINLNWVKGSFAYLGVNVPVSEAHDIYYLNFYGKINGLIIC